jgi:K+-transporting ATPase ATPase C chain
VKNNLKIAVRMTMATTVLLGIVYPLLVTGLAQLIFHDKANGQLITSGGTIIGSRILGQSFTRPGYFHSRPSAAGRGYDASNSGGSQLGPTNRTLVERVNADASQLRAENPSTPVPIDLVTTSASGLDPDISPAGALFQAPRVARDRNLPEAEVIHLIQSHTKGRQWGLLGEPTVNVLELNLALDEVSPRRALY